LDYAPDESAESLWGLAPQVVPMLATDNYLTGVYYAREDIRSIDVSDRVGAVHLDHYRDGSKIERQTWSKHNKAAIAALHACATHPCG
jgi:hypothetical protein